MFKVKKARRLVAIRKVKKEQNPDSNQDYIQKLIMNAGHM